MAIVNCITNSITLAVGENFTLPPGASIISVSDVASIQSDCLDISSLEGRACYCFQILFTEERGDTTPVYKNNNVDVHGLYIASTKQFYPFTSSLAGIGSILANISTSIPTTPSLGSMFTNICVNYDEGARDRGQVVNVCFEILPSIGDDLFMKTSTSAFLDPDFESYYYLPAIPRADAIVTGCPCALS